MAPKTSAAKTPLPVKLGDSPSMRRAMEDAVVDLMEAKGYKQDHKKKDAWCAFGIVAVLVTLLAQFWPGKWPKNYYLSAVCVVIFGICQGAMELINLDDSLVFDSTATTTGPVRGRVHVTARFPKYTSEVKMMVGSASNRKAHTLEFSVGEVFDTKGYLVRSALLQRLDSALKAYAAQTGESKKTK